MTHYMKQEGGYALFELGILVSLLTIVNFYNNFTLQLHYFFLKLQFYFEFNVLLLVCCFSFIISFDLVMFIRPFGEIKIYPIPDPNPPIICTQQVGYGLCSKYPIYGALNKYLHGPRPKPVHNRVWSGQSLGTTR